MSDFGDNIISISDEDGNDFDLLVLDEAIYRDVRYLALSESLSPEEEENLDIIILKVIEDEATGEEILSTLDDDQELEAVYQIFEEQMFADDEIVGEEDE